MALVERKEPGLFENSYKITDELPNGETLPYGGASITNFPQNYAVNAYGGTSGKQTGYIRESNVSINYGSGVICEGFIACDYRSNYGDSGAPVWNGIAYVGMQSGSSFNSDGSWAGMSYAMPTTYITARRTESFFWFTTF